MRAVFGPESDLYPSASFATFGQITASPLGPKYLAEADGHYEDHRLLQRALTDLAGQGGGLLEVVGGRTYAMKGKVTIPSGVTVRGLGGAAVFRAADGMNDVLVEFADGTTDAALEGIRLDGNSAGQASGTLVRIGASCVGIRVDCTLIDAKTSRITVGTGCRDVTIGRVPGEVEARACGVVADGATDDSPALRDAVAIGCALKTAVRLPFGRMAVQSEVNIPSGYTALLGKGAGGSVLVPIGTLDRVISVGSDVTGLVGAPVNCEHVRLEEIEIDGTEATEVGWGIHMEDLAIFGVGKNIKVHHLPDMTNTTLGALVALPAPTTITPAVTVAVPAVSQTVAVASSAGLIAGMTATVTGGGGTTETLTITAVGAGTITAVFVQARTAGATITVTGQRVAVAALKNHFVGQFVDINGGGGTLERVELTAVDRTLNLVTGAFLQARTTGATLAMASICLGNGLGQTTVGGIPKDRNQSWRFNGLYLSFSGIGLLWQGRGQETQFNSVHSYYHRWWQVQAGSSTVSMTVLGFNDLQLESHPTLDTGQHGLLIRNVTNARIDTFYGECHHSLTRAIKILPGLASNTQLVIDGFYVAGTSAPHLPDFPVEVPVVGGQNIELTIRNWRLSVSLWNTSYAGTAANGFIFDSNGVSVLATPMVGRVIHSEGGNSTGPNYVLAVLNGVSRLDSLSLVSDLAVGGDLSVAGEVDLATVGSLALPDTLTVGSGSQSATLQPHTAVRTTQAAITGGVGSQQVTVVGALATFGAAPKIVRVTGGGGAPAEIVTLTAIGANTVDGVFLQNRLAAPDTTTLTLGRDLRLRSQGTNTGINFMQDDVSLWQIDTLGNLVAQPGYKIAAPKKVTTRTTDTSAPLVIADGVTALAKASAGAWTLADPAASDEGTVMRITSQTAQAHTVDNGAGSGFNAGGAGSDRATFGGAIGDNFVIVAVNLKWHVLSLRGVTLG